MSEEGKTTGSTPLDPDPDTIKMFVGQIPRHWNEPDCRKLFEKYGPVFSLNILRDRQTQVSKGCCFVTFYHRRDAIAAQSALHNIEIIDGMHHPVQMKPADTENRNERKLFIGQLAKKHNEEDIRSYFGKFGHIEECTVLREADGKSRGCAFVTYTNRTSALAAIKDMHHSTTMEGCSAPLVVKFADTQREKEVKKLPGSAGTITSAASGLASLGNQAALLQQLTGGGVNLQALTALAALFNPGMQAQQHNLLGVLGGAALLHQSPIQPQNLETIAQLQQAQLQHAQLAQAQAHAQAQAQHQQLFAMQVQAQQAQPAVNALASHMNAGAQVSVSGAGSGDVKGPEGSNLFIYHLPQDFGDSDLHTTFSPFGTVLSAKVFIDKVTNLSKCFGFVSYDNAVSAQNAIAAMNGFQIGSKRLKVQLKNERSHPYPKATV
ncbi:hypothetical protein V3C99_011189 [Haemonchus contortus]|uniref:CUGBP Elav-like family member 2 n=1 Tax=Haemonchus contortus TaxID=6289 RepID=A0A6F7P0N6_HAECO